MNADVRIEKIVPTQKTNYAFWKDCVMPVILQSKITQIW